MRCWRKPLSKPLILLICVFLATTLAQAPKGTISIKKVPGSPYPAGNLHPGPAWFIDVAPQAGLRMENVNGGVDTKKYIIETTGSGVAILDYDNDGWPDIFLVNGTTLDEQKARSERPTSHLFHNNHDGTFTDVTQAAGLDFTGWGQGACVGDYDNDGFDDLYVTYYGKNRLYHNEGNGTFKEVAAAGVAGDGKAWGTGCAFVDYDRDGKLDLLVANYVLFDIKTSPRPGEGMMCVWKGTPVMCGPRGLESSPNILYHNLGNGKFEDVSKSSRIGKTYGHYCLSVSTLDYDDDGWPDIYVACDIPISSRRTSLTIHPLSITTMEMEHFPPPSLKRACASTRAFWAGARCFSTSTMMAGPTFFLSMATFIRKSIPLISAPHTASLASCIGILEMESLKTSASSADLGARNRSQVEVWR